MLTDNK